MKITYIKLENVAGLIVGSDKNYLEIDFSKSTNNIIAIQGPNGAGKTVLLSSISPFASTTSLDDRSSLPYIKSGKDGYKEIHYTNGVDKFTIKHYYKPNRNGKHSVKSYFSINDKEYNENGNVSSFLDLVELHFGVTTDLMRLMRLGSNVKSIISLSPTERKTYIGNLITQIEQYLQIYKKINEDLRSIKVLRSANANNIHNCHITDPVVEKSIIKQLNKEINKLDSEYAELMKKLGNIQALENGNDLDTLKRKLHDAKSKIYEFQTIENTIKSQGLEGKSVDDLIGMRNVIMDERLELQSQINGLRMTIDSNCRNLEKLDVMIKRVTSNNDMNSLIDLISTLRQAVNDTPGYITSFTPNGSTSEDINMIFNKLSSFNQIYKMICTFNKQSMDVYTSLYRENRSVDEFLKDQLSKRNSSLNGSDIVKLINQLFDKDDIILPACDEPNICPYYRLSNVISEARVKLDEVVLDDETLNYISTISKNIDNILNEIESFRRIPLTDALRESLKESSIMGRFESGQSFFDLSLYQEYLTVLRDYELYLDNKSRLIRSEEQLKLFKQSGVDNYLSESNELKLINAQHQSSITNMTSQLAGIGTRLNQIDSNISQVTKYMESKNTQSMLLETIESVTKTISPLEEAAQEKINIQREIDAIKIQLSYKREELKKLENRLHRYKELVKEGEELDEKFNVCTMIEQSVSTRKGIPVIYMQKYLGQIQTLSNDLLDLTYDGNLRLSEFHVTQDTFEIPYDKQGYIIEDVKYASQSEISLMTMALSFALLTKASDKYNIILLDEIDSGLDDDNRGAFLKMLRRQMQLLESEQVFIISHNMTQMINVPMDVIQLQSSNVNSKLQNVIY